MMWQMITCHLMIFCKINRELKYNINIFHVLFLLKNDDVVFNDVTHDDTLYHGTSPDDMS